jgi:hypothetical protein
VASLSLKAIVQITGANPYIHVDSAKVETLKQGWRRPMPVLVRINNQLEPPWKTNMIPVGDGSFYLYLHGPMRKFSSTAVGDQVEISLDFDDDYRNGPLHAMPKTFAQALSACPQAQTSWEALPPSRKKEILRYFDGLKWTDAIDRNTERAIQVLSGLPGRYMGRDWQDGA